jgi:uncharacterized iron-regulated membrane protein
VTALTWAGYIYGTAYVAMCAVFSIAWAVRGLAGWRRRRRSDREWAARVGATIRAIRADFDGWEQELASERSKP